MFISASQHSTFKMPFDDDLVGSISKTSLVLEKSLKELKEDEKKLFHRNKLNLIADSSEEGWEVVNEYQRWQVHTTGRGKSFTETPARPIGERKTAFSSSKAPSLPVSPLPIVVSGYGTLVSPSYPDIS